MYHDICMSMYGYIMEIEIFFLTHYKLNPFEVLKDMTLLDLETYMKKVEKYEKEQQESIKKNDIMKSLYMINQILSMMFYKK